MKSKFIVIEGLEGAGKSTAVNVIANFIKRKVDADVIFTREPGGTQIAEALRTITKNIYHDEILTNKTELLLMFAARSQLVENIIKPALNENKWVIGDRHNLSTLAYQGYGRKIDTHFINLLGNYILDDFKPDLTIYLDISPELGLLRAKERGELDRIETESLQFFEDVREGYKTLIKNDKSVIEIDATKTLQQVTSSIEFSLTNWFEHVGNR